MDIAYFLLNINDIKETEIQDIEENYPERFKKAKNFRFKEDFLRCIGGYILLKRFFGNFSEKDVTFNEFGKPSIVGKKQFNISHSGDYVLLAVDENILGADIEKIKDGKERLYHNVFTEDEISWMNEKDNVERFYILWTQKESVIKLLGKGLQIPLNSFSVLPFEEGKFIEFNGIKIKCNSFIFEKEYAISITKII